MKTSFPLPGVVCLFLSWLWLDSGLRAEDATGPSRPNILFAIADDWSFGHAGAYGCGWVKTPGFDRVAREGILFTRAYTPNAKCAPSRACILTGRNSWQLKDACNHICNFPPEFKSYVEALGENGYHVGYTGKGWGPGIALDPSGKPRHITGQRFSHHTAPPPGRAMSNNDYSRNFASFLESVPGDSPWCFWYGTLEPHRGYEFGVGVRQGKKSLDDVDRVPQYWPDNETIRHDMLDYAFEVEHFDHHLVRILETLEARNQLENTLVVVTSDHGMPFPRCKGQAYDASNHIPLAIRWPVGVADPGREEGRYVSFIELAPTFVEVAGLDWIAVGMAPTPAPTLGDVFANETDARLRDHVLIGKERHDIGRPAGGGYPIRGIVQNDLLYLRNYEPARWPAGNPETGYLNCDGSPTKTEILNLRRNSETDTFWQMCFGKRSSEELYDLSQDPDCVRNLAEDPQFTQRKLDLAQRMEYRLKQQLDPRMEGRGSYFDQIEYTNAGTRHFYERYLRGERPSAGWVNESDFEPEPLD